MNSKFEHVNLLLPFYGKLLSERQLEILKYYYYEDLSLSEIAENLSISRNAVFDALRKGERALEDLEVKLHLYADYQKRLEQYRLILSYNNSEINTIIEKLIKEEESYE